MTRRLRIAYAGTPEFAVPALQAIANSKHILAAVLTQPDRKSGRGRKVSESAVKQAVTSGNVPILQPENVNQDETLKQLSAYHLDMMVVAAYGQIFSQSLLDLPRLGCINIHASLLPRWRGASPIQHAILEGDDVSGVTIMQMVRAMDAGDIWHQSRCHIHPEDTSQDLHDTLAQIGGDIIIDGIQRIASGGATPIPQDEQATTYCTKLKKSDGLIDWDQPAQQILRKIRAFHPWPGAYTYLNGRRLRILKAEPISIEAEALPGTICQQTPSGFSVVTQAGDGISVLQLTPEGGKKVSAKDFCHSNQLQGQQLSMSGD